MSDDPNAPSVYESRGLATVGRRGRRRLAEGESTTPVSVRVPDSVYDRLCREATAHRLELSAFVRLRLLGRL